MIVFILGGVKGGKSMFAQHLARLVSPGAPLYYFATMIPGDAEDAKRIRRHIHDRSGWGFNTVEEGISFRKGMAGIPTNATVLVDSITAYVQNNVFSPKGQTADEAMFADIDSLTERAADAIIVSDYIFSDALDYPESVTAYLRTLGEVHKYIASRADMVLECTFSNIRELKNTRGYDLSQVTAEYLKSTSHLLYADI